MFSAILEEYEILWHSSLLFPISSYIEDDVSLFINQWKFLLHIFGCSLRDKSNYEPPHIPAWKKIMIIQTLLMTTKFYTLESWRLE